MNKVDEEIVGWAKPNPDWWYIDGEDHVLDDQVFYGCPESRFFTLKLEPTNRGTSLKFTILYNEDLGMGGDIEGGWLEIGSKEGCQDASQYNQTFKLGDFAQDDLVTFALALLNMFEPRLAPSQEKVKEWQNRHEEKEEQK